MIEWLIAVILVCFVPGLCAAAVCLLILVLVGLDASVIRAACAAAFLGGSILGSLGAMFVVRK